MQKEEEMLQKRLIELSRTAYQRGIAVFSDFLNMNEQNILHTIPKDKLYAAYDTFGGYDYSERQMAAFLPDALCYTPAYPICALRTKPVQAKFAEPLTHRDYLGAALNLGIDRSRIGDILVEDACAVMFVHASLRDYLTDSLGRVRHTSVTVSAEEITDGYERPKGREIRGSVSSVRLDSLLALAFSASRSRLTPLIEGGKVFVNGRLVTSNACPVREEDIVSVRGYGRFRYVGMTAQTKKGRSLVTLEVFH